MRTSHFACVALGCLVIALSGCQTGDLSVGQQIITPNNLAVGVVDSTTIRTATVLADSFFTYSDPNVLVGQWNSPISGKTQAKGFVSIGYAPNTLSTQTGLVYDSLVLVLPIGFTYGDTTSLFSLNVYRLTGLFKNRAYSNHAAIDYEPTPYLTRTVTAGPTTNIGAYRFRLPTAVQQDVVSRLVNRTIENQEELDAYLKGFALVATPSTNVMFGINTTSANAGLTLYYHTSDLVPVNATLTFPLKTQDPQVATGHFSQVVTDFGQSPLGALKNRSDAVSTAKTGNQAMVIPLAQLTTQLTIPALDKYSLGSGQFRGVNRANLSLEPIWPNLRDNAPPTGTLYLYQTNDNNQLIDINGAAIGLVQSGAGPTVSASLFNLTPGALIPQPAYRFDLTYYINQIIAGRIPNRPLLLSPYSLSQQAFPPLQLMAQRLMFGNVDYGQYRLKLELYVTTEQ